MFFNIVLIVAACLLAGSPFLYRKCRDFIDIFIDYIERKQFERLVDRVAGR